MPSSVGFIIVMLLSAQLPASADERGGLLEAALDRAGEHRPPLEAALELNKAWFQKRAAAKPGDPQHAIDAVSYKPTPTLFSMVWAQRDQCLYAVDVTDRYTSGPAARVDDAMKWIMSAETSVLSGEPVPDVRLGLQDVERVKQALWKKYCREVKVDPVRKSEHAERRLTFDGAAMRYAYTKIGDQPDHGYPLYIALHGGGGAPAQVNDGGWRHMQIYYRDSVKVGVYVAPRGVSDTWNLHFREQSYPLYDRLIENMIAIEDVDPDRVYLLGFSAGGDGTYQAAPRMADRWAAANMSAGHHNGVSPRNLQHVPFLIQVGERDAAYGRNKAAVEYFRKIVCLREAGPSGYVSEAFVHADRPHNFLDNRADGAPQAVIADPVAWLSHGKRELVKKDTNAIHWLAQHSRTPWPRRIAWDLKTGANRSGQASDGKMLWAVPRGRSFYWLSVDNLGNDMLEADEIVASCDPARNAVRIEKAGAYLRLLLNADMLNLGEAVVLDLEGQKLQRHVYPTLRNLVRTLRDRGDPRFMFEGTLVLEKENGRWRVRG